jgi:hypothetical protein
LAVEELTAVTVGGIAIGVAEDEAEELFEVPAPFVAVDVNVYAVPLARPVTVQEPDAAETVQVLVTPPTCGEAVTR